MPKLLHPTRRFADAGCNEAKILFNIQTVICDLVAEASKQCSGHHWQSDSRAGHLRVYKLNITRMGMLSPVNCIFLVRWICMHNVRQRDDDGPTQMLIALLYRMLMSLVDTQGWPLVMGLQLRVSPN